MKQEDIPPIAQLHNFPRCHCSVHAQQVNFTVGRLCLNKTAQRKKNEKRPRNSYQQGGLGRVGTCRRFSASLQFTKGHGGLDGKTQAISLSFFFSASSLCQSSGLGSLCYSGCGCWSFQEIKKAADFTHKGRGGRK